MCRPTRILAVFLLAGMSLSVGAVEIDVGGRQVIVTIPDGYAELTPNMSPYYETARAYIAPTNYRYLSLIPKAKVDALLSSEVVELERYMNVESEKGISTQSVSAAMFDEFRGILRTQLDEMFEKANKRLPGMFDKANAKLSESFDVDIAFSTENIVPLPIHLDSTNALASSMYVNYEFSINDEDMGSDVVAGTMLLLHVKDKVLFLYVYGPESDLEWTRDFAANWAVQIIAANPVSAEVKRALDRPVSHGVNWDRVLENAALGGLIGVFIGFFVMLLRRRNKK